MSYAFGGTLVDSRENLLQIIGQEWMFANGTNEKEEVIRYLDTMSAEELATECYEGWFEDHNEYEITLEELISLFRELEDDRYWLEK